MAPKKRRWRIPAGFERAFVELQDVPNIGKAMAEDLVRLRVRGVKDLAKRDPVKMYNGMTKLDGVPHDPCVLDAFMSAVHFARTGERRVWWSFTPERKMMMAGKGAPRRRKAGRSGRRSRR